KNKVSKNIPKRNIPTVLGCQNPIEDLATPSLKTILSGIYENLFNTIIEIKLNIWIKRKEFSILFKDTSFKAQIIINKSNSGEYPVFSLTIINNTATMMIIPNSLIV